MDIQELRATPRIDCYSRSMSDDNTECGLVIDISETGAGLTISKDTPFFMDADPEQSANNYGCLHLNIFHPDFSLENSLNKSTFQTGVSGLVTGFITKYSEQAVTLKLFDDFNRVAKNIGKNKFIKELKSGRLLLNKDAVSKAWIPQTLELGGVVGGGLVKENDQESLESILDQGIVRNIILGENVNVFEEINEDLFANTSFATLLMLSGKTINNANAIIKELSLIHI